MLQYYSFLKRLLEAEHIAKKDGIEEIEIQVGHDGKNLYKSIPMVARCLSHTIKTRKNEAVHNIVFIMFLQKD